MSRYNFSTKPATFGPGFYKLNVTKLISGAQSTEYTLQTYTDLLYDNPEFDRIINDFKYFKLNHITVTFPPRNVSSQDNLNPLYFIINYDGTRTVNLRLQDSAKIVPAYITNTRHYKFKIPKLSTNGILLNGWIEPSDFIKLDKILFQFYAPENTIKWNIRIDINISCRGPTGQENKQILNLEEKIFKEIGVQTDIKEQSEIGIQTTNEDNILRKECKKHIKIIKELQEKLKIKNEEIKDEFKIKKLIKKLDKEDEKEIKPKSLKSFKSEYCSVKSFNSDLTNQSLPSVKSEDYNRALEETNKITEAFEKYAERAIAIQLLGEHYKDMFTVYDIILNVGKRLINENVENYDKFKDIFKEECKKKSKFLRKKLKEEDFKKIFFIIDIKNKDN